MDSAPSKPVHRLLFRGLCEEHRVKIICRHGQVPEGEMGELLEFVSAWAKEGQVTRAQIGARDGLRDRAAIKGIPASAQSPFGYNWNGKQFEPDLRTFHVARRIWKLALDGVPLRGIARQLMDAGIASPSGSEVWYASSIARMLQNPTYSGSYVALRTRTVEPKYRRGDTYGKTGREHRDESEQIPLTGVVGEAIVSSEEFELVQRRLKRNKAEGGKVVQRYLLRRRVRCGECGRRLRGKVIRRPSKTYYRYMCRGPLPFEIDQRARAGEPRLERRCKVPFEPRDLSPNPPREGVWLAS